MIETKDVCSLLGITPSQESMIDNMNRIGELFDSVDLDRLQPETQELIGRLMLFFADNANIREESERQQNEAIDKVTELIKENTKIAKVLSNFLVANGLDEEFREYLKKAVSVTSNTH